MPKNNSKASREGRKSRALKRKEDYEKMGTDQKIARAATRPGNSKKELDRLGRTIVQQVPREARKKMRRAPRAKAKS